MHRQYDVAVLGAGIAGSAVAKALADRGWETVLIDQRQFPRHKVCGEFLSPESQGILRALGLHEAVQSLQPSRINRTRLILNGGDALEMAMPGIALGISRHSMDSMLHKEAVKAGVELQTATTVTSVLPRDKGYTIETKQNTEPRTVMARAVIAAWGAGRRSGLPGPSPNSTAKKYIGIKSHFSGVEAEPVVDLYFFSGGYIGVCPVEHGIVNIAALVEHDAFQGHAATITGLIEAAARRNPVLCQRLSQAVPISGTQAAVAPVHLTRKPLAWDIIPRVGDAMLMLPPLCGDGMSMALRSAQLCSSFTDSYLHGNLSLSQWEHEYSQSIRREFLGPLRWGQLIQSLVNKPILSTAALRLARMTPRVADRLLRATRLKEIDFLEL
ncbi:NAD(P)/FAD-dependent oxidoreductase [Paenibacillus sp. H1-7]|uniref:NAD(P)/FAD-dependent oxidoreductase n=1 Tax=Paenibacillus sp. H1-7 TaxID=2282849 RepID=UPI001EF76925|nr:NAD(P)/FAD-dependent oxidoreductase [Paenibacillus sp. H1-7]ULL19919.1 NAD(P)/FAD-dependent oxidoreductase [Paenibacillus sp. H1-7]